MEAAAHWKMAMPRALVLAMSASGPMRLSGPSYLYTSLRYGTMRTCTPGIFCLIRLAMAVTLLAYMIFERPGPCDGVQPGLAGVMKMRRVWSPLDPGELLVRLIEGLNHVLVGIGCVPPLIPGEHPLADGASLVRRPVGVQRTAPGIYGCSPRD